VSALRRPSLVISCHADTGFLAHRLRRPAPGVVEGHLDNFAGVHAVMLAYFSGRLCLPRVRVELTHGEEVDMAGAREVLATLHPGDVVVVVDVTGTPTHADLVIEKCRSPRMQAFVREALGDLSFDLYADCPDPIADQDECDVYGALLPDVFFLGIPCTGGDYNAGAVRCRDASLQAAAEALLRLAERFQGLH
jgi:hypothetical protein